MAELLLISHGKIASAILESAQQIMGPRNDIQALCLDVNHSPKVFETMLNNKLQSLNSKTIIVLADIAGGTPVNVIIKLCLQYTNVTIISGLNLPMVLAYINHSDQENLAEKVIQAGINSIINISDQARLYNIKH